VHPYTVTKQIALLLILLKAQL